MVDALLVLVMARMPMHDTEDEVEVEKALMILVQQGLMTGDMLRNGKMMIVIMTNDDDRRSHVG